MLKTPLAQANNAHTLSPTQDPKAGQGQLAGDLVASLRGTRLWVLLPAMVGMYCLYFLFAIGSSAFASLNMLGLRNNFLFFSTLCFWIFCPCLLIPIWWLGRFLRATGRIGQGDIYANTATALEYQRKFWKSLSITLLILIAFLALDIPHGINVFPSPLDILWGLHFMVFG